MFREVVELSLDGFNHQNAILGMSIEDIAGRQMERMRFSVSIDRASGVEAIFLCFEIEVLSVEPYMPGPPKGSPYGYQAGPRS